MVKIAPIRLRYSPKVLWFDPCGLDLRASQSVVVETARGIELGTLAQDIMEVTEEAVEALPSALMPVLRLATEDDEDLADELDQRAREALPIYKDLAALYCPTMHPIGVEFLLDTTKAIFYFESEDRVDFRDLVRELAAQFHIRVDMRQVGVRDKARIVGGLGHCGQEICCRRLGGEFNPVSIRMAKDQDLSLNPQKISGLCGRLMCCLRYEFDIYRDFKSRAPKVGATIMTPDGPAKVSALDPLKETVTLDREDEPSVKVSLKAFEKTPEGTRPKQVSEQGWNEALNALAPLLRDSLMFFNDPTTEHVTIDTTDKKPKNEPSEEKKEGTTKRSARRRNKTTISAKGKSSHGESTPENDGVKSESSANASTDPVRQKPTRRKKRSSGTTSENTVTKRSTERVRRASGVKEAGNNSTRTTRPPARQARRHRTIDLTREGDGGSNAMQDAKTSGQSQVSSRDNTAHGDRPRPGRRSSGLRGRSSEQNQNSSETEAKR